MIAGEEPFMRFLSGLFGGKKDNEEHEREEKEAHSRIDGRALTSEREEEIINGIVDKVLRYGMEGPALLIMYPLKASNVLVAELGVLPYAPFLELFGLRGYDYVTFLNKRENVDRIIKKIEEHYHY